MILLIANSKGGVGKTSLATSFLAELAKNNAVIGVDLDSSNKSASEVWSENRTELQGKFYYLSGDIKAELEKAGKEYDHMVIDAGGYDNAELRASMTIADVILVPLRVGANSNVSGFWKTVDLITAVNETRKNKAKVLGVITCTPHVGSKPEIERAIQSIIDEPHIEPVGTTIGDRTWYGRAFDAGLGVTEFEPENHREKRYIDIAKNEFMELFNEVVK